MSRGIHTVSNTSFLYNKRTDEFDYSELLLERFLVN